MNAPAGFQRFMEHCLEGIRDKFVTPYLDDLTIYSSPFEDQKSEIKLKTSKCQLFKNEVSYLGRLVSSEGYTADPENVAAVKLRIKWPSKTIT